MISTFFFPKSFFIIIYIFLPLQFHNYLGQSTLFGTSLIPEATMQKPQQNPSPTNKIIKLEKLTNK